MNYVYKDRKKTWSHNRKWIAPVHKGRNCWRSYNICIARSHRNDERLEQHGIQKNGQHIYFKFKGKRYCWKLMNKVPFLMEFATVVDNPFQTSPSLKEVASTFACMYDCTWPCTYVRTYIYTCPCMYSRHTSVWYWKSRTLVFVSPSDVSHVVIVHRSVLVHVRCSSDVVVDEHWTHKHNLVLLSILPDQRSTVASLVRNTVSAVHGFDVDTFSREPEDSSVENSTDKLCCGASQRWIHVRHHRTMNDGVPNSLYSSTEPIEDRKSGWSSFHPSRQFTDLIHIGEVLGRMKDDNISIQRLNCVQYILDFSQQRDRLCPGDIQTTEDVQIISILTMNINDPLIRWSDRQISRCTVHLPSTYSSTWHFNSP